MLVLVRSLSVYLISYIRAWATIGFNGAVNPYPLLHFYRNVHVRSRPCRLFGFLLLYYRVPDLNEFLVYIGICSLIFEVCICLWRRDVYGGVEGKKSLFSDFK